MIQLTTNKPLHKQYRPDTFENVVGQEKVVKRLQVVGRRGFGGKAVWLYGESGTGKTTLAYIVGKAMILFLVFAGVAGQAAASVGASVHDAFGRDIGERGLTLVDWEGHLANPTATFTVTPPAGAALPVTAELSSSAVLLYFDLPARATAEGPRKTLTFNDTKAQTVRAAIFPDRDDAGETHMITIHFTDQNKKETTLELPVHVIDQDRPRRKGGFPFVLDYSQDKTGFFKEAKHREVVKQAATDWGYFLDGSGLDETRAGTEVTWIWPPADFVNGTMTTNKKAYTGFLIYAYGIHTMQERGHGVTS